MYLEDEADLSICAECNLLYEQAVQYKLIVQLLPRLVRPETLYLTES